jgi:hypothetical protein
MITFQEIQDRAEELKESIWCFLDENESITKKEVDAKTREKVNELLDQIDDLGSDTI